MPGLRRAGERGASGERASGGEGLLSPAATSELVLAQKRAQRNILDTAEQQIRAHGANTCRGMFLCFSFCKHATNIHICFTTIQQALIHFNQITSWR